MIELVLEITSRAGSLPSTVQALGMVMFQAKMEHACLDCRLYSEIGNPKSLRYVEQWQTLEELESQVRSQRFGMLLAIMETAASPPKLEIRTISEQRDLEYVSAVRLNLDGMAPVKEETQLQS
jgi:quinol monooxygenase YgiN